MQNKHLLLAVGLFALSPIMAASAADVLLSGAVTSASGEKLGGVAIAAKQDGTTITTTGILRYGFPPRPESKRPSPPLNPACTSRALLLYDARCPGGP